MRWLALDAGDVSPVLQESAVSRPVVSERISRLEKIRDVDEFGNVGTPEFLKERARLRLDQIENEKRKAQEVIEQWAAGAEERRRRREALEAPSPPPEVS